MPVFNLVRADFHVRPGLSLAALVAGLALFTVACSDRRDGAPANLILTGGTILTLDPAHPEDEALAVRGGVIAAVAGDDAIQAMAGPSTRRIDLQGAFVIPGLIDAHGHIRSLGERLAALDLRGIASPSEIADRVAGRAAELPPGEWVTGGGWDQNLWPVKEFPDHRPLTEAAPDRPVWLSRIDGHAGWANLKAMQAAGITRDTVDPPGGLIVRDDRGEPTGVLIDNAGSLIETVLPPTTGERLKSQIVAALERCAEVGLTEVHDAGVTEEEVAAFRELADADKLPLRVYLMWGGMDGASLERLPPPLINYRDRLTLRTVKLMIDGAMGSRGALFFEDYSDDPGNRGLTVMSPEEVERATTVGLGSGYQVATHAIGDRGISLTLDAYENALVTVPVPDPRLRIEHFQCTRRGDVDRMKQLGVIASMQPTHATSDMYWAERRVGPDRGRGLYAWRWVLDAGVALAAGSDFPVELARPLNGLHAAVTRQDQESWPEGGWHPEQALSLEEALHAYTTGAAYAAFEERMKGRIAPGYWADLTVLSRDLRSIPREQIPQAGVAYTIVGGRIVYQAQ
jgi:predicted amidohydrolase YtcJ